MKLNNKGYMLVEVIVSFTLAIIILFFMTNATISLKNKADDLYLTTKLEADQLAMTKVVMDDINKYEILKVEDKGGRNNVNLTFNIEGTETTKKVSYDESKKLFKYGKVNNSDEYIGEDLYTKQIDSHLNVGESLIIVKCYKDGTYKSGSVCDDVNIKHKKISIKIPGTTAYNNNDYGISYDIDYNYNDIVVIKNPVITFKAAENTVAIGWKEDAIDSKDTEILVKASYNATKKKYCAKSPYMRGQATFGDFNGNYIYNVGFNIKRWFEQEEYDDYIGKDGEEVCVDDDETLYGRIYFAGVISIDIGAQYYFRYYETLSHKFNENEIAITHCSANVNNKVVNWDEYMCDKFNYYSEPETLENRNDFIGYGGTGLNLYTAKLIKSNNASSSKEIVVTKYDSYFFSAEEYKTLNSPEVNRGIINNKQKDIEAYANALKSLEKHKKNIIIETKNDNEDVIGFDASGNNVYIAKWIKNTNKIRITIYDNKGNKIKQIEDNKNQSEQIVGFSTSEGNMYIAKWKKSNSATSSDEIIITKYDKNGNSTQIVKYNKPDSEEFVAFDTYENDIYVGTRSLERKSSYGDWNDYKFEITKYDKNGAGIDIRYGNQGRVRAWGGGELDVTAFEVFGETKSGKNLGIATVNVSRTINRYGIVDCQQYVRYVNNEKYDYDSHDCGETKVTNRDNSVLVKGYFIQLEDRY